MPNRPPWWQLMRHQGHMGLATMRPQSRTMRLVDRSCWTTWEADATVASHDPILASHDTTAESQDTTQGSHDTTAESHDATPGSHGELADGVLMRQNQAPYSEILQNEIHEDPTPPPAATGAPAGGDGGGLTAT